MVLRHFWNFFTSLRLTVACLILALVLVFAGTLAQVHQGLYQVQAHYFKSLLVWWSPPGASWHIPVFPGGYLIGGVLLVNLVAGHIKRFGFSKGKTGIILIHAGLILLLLGQLATDLLSVESSMRLPEGTAKNYSEDFQASEMVVIDTTPADYDQVVAIPDKLLRAGREFPVTQTPLTVRVKQYWPNCDLYEQPAPNAAAVGATQGAGSRLFISGRPLTTKTDERNLPAALVELFSPQGSLGSWLVDYRINTPQTFTFENRTYQLGMRATRYYKPFSLYLVDFRHDKYTGTDIPKNFSSRLRLQNPQTKEDREVLIYMNNPLRYHGETFYQGGYQGDNVTILQVVRNPSWLTPYFSCLLVGAGLMVQFGWHLFGFLKRRTA